MKFKTVSTIWILGCVVCLAALSGNSFAQGGPPPDVAICHLTESETNPFELITVPAPAAEAHFAHGDVLPVEGACPNGNTGGGGDPDPGAVPEPLTVLLFGAGLAGVGYATRRLRRRGQTEGDDQV